MIQKQSNYRRSGRARNSIKKMLIVFLDVKGIVHCEFVRHYSQLWLLLLCFETRERKCSTKNTRTLAQPQLVPSSRQRARPHVPENDRVVTNNNMVIVPHPPYSPDLAPVISLCFPNWKWIWRDNVLKQCLTYKRSRKGYSTALGKMTSTVLLKSKKKKKK
jgi:hypothetical protein